MRFSSTLIMALQMTYFVTLSVGPENGLLKINIGTIFQIKMWTIPMSYSYIIHITRTSPG